ncbi:MAG: hypothetical protein OXQ31_15160 [Spirochaetaceae bacterium]|nr:hypothetical protein [Spirochaetaceae bacterium]
MSNDEQRRIKADLLLAIHENETLIGCIDARLDRIKWTLSGVHSALEGGYLRAVDGKLSTGNQDRLVDFPDESELVRLVKQKEAAKAEATELATRRKEIHL